MTDQQPPDGYVVIDIPESVQDDIAALIRALGDPNKNAETLAAAWRKVGEFVTTPGRHYAICANITLTLTQAVRQRAGVPDGETMQLAFVHACDPAHPHLTDVDEVPTVVAHVGRWFTAAGNDDVDTLLALWGAIPEDEQFVDQFHESMAGLWMQLASALLAGSPQ